MKSLGVLFINSSRIYGGTETWALRAAKELQSRGHRVLVGYRYSIIKNHAHIFGLPTVKLPLISDSDIYSVYRIGKTMVDNNLQVVLPTRDREYWLGAIAAKFVSRKCVIRLGIVRDLKKKWKNRNLYGKWADAIQVNANAIVDALRNTNFIPPGKIHQFYDGVETPDSLPDSENHPRPFIFVYVGSLIVRKNVGLIVRMFQKLCSAMPEIDMRLWLVGDGEERDNLKHLAAELSITGKVIFWGHRDDIPSLLQQSHALVLLSKNEGFPTVILEGMAWGVPPVIGKIPGIEEIVKHEKNGLVVNLENETEILNALQRIVKEDFLRSTLRESGFNIIKNHFSREIMGANLEKLLFEVIDNA